MRNFTLLLLSIIFSISAYSQCTTTTGGNYGNLVMVNDGTAEQIAADNWPNAEYSAIEGLIIGNTYTVTGTNTTSIYITVAEIDWQNPVVGGTVLAHGASSVSFTATTTDVIIHWHLNATCQTQDSDATVTTIQCTSPSCTCTATMMPDAANITYPANGAIDVPIDMTDPANPVINGFAWTDNGAATTYDLNLLTVGTVTGVTSPVNITYGSWAYDTTYTWNITSTNCLGTVTSANYTFTTEADPNLSTDEFNIKPFSIYPNPTSDFIKIKTELTINSVEVFNQLGQKVLSLNNDQIIDNSINVKEFNNGIYFMTITAEERKETFKFIKE
ncbi:T9SS type A sorting domain-containing protein [Mesoflavibacter sp. SCSIO 43206]|uniref:T9SS type A sorting domain-containing protein n=1 Tax=Mesoflavibacter sp. SCSIO 43206 TaxID=2779362 RepID=UPI001CA9C0BC|nr:T9SS type A sorting domain-containing protein [Mesoflavibacter sp. SCSIO 43206]UAB75974.1 T9SS type A sorting domain-containing protein [Mesoflavibacter sp. SCSIO 43206]